MDQLHQLSAQYNTLWIETNQLYETWARPVSYTQLTLPTILRV